MRIDRVTARAFGPFQDEVLDLAPGMTVVSGPNEAGKSSWHAAIRLALTGLRRGKGPAGAIERQLVERHRPWGASDRWEVEARLTLDDGRVIDIAQDLAGKVDCRAVEVGIGRDVSGEIMNGTPDASLWLGLDRDAFAATVCVGQAQVMAVATDETAGLLQEHMQRAAATRGTDATAAEALDRLAEFRKRGVGADISTSRGPLRSGKGRLAAAEAALDEARGQHEGYLAHGETREAAVRGVEDARHRLAVGEAVVARGLADEAAAQARRAAQLAARHPTRPRLAERDERADRVAAALAAWERRPRAIELSGPTRAALEAELATLPPAPEGDLRPHPAVVAALRQLDVAEGAVAQFEPGQVPAPMAVRRPTAPAFAGGALAAGIAALAAVLLGAPLPAAVLMVAAGALGIGAWWAVRVGEAAAAEHAATALRLADLEQRRVSAERRLSRAREDLLGALAERGVASVVDPRDGWVTYEAACDERARQADAAGRAESLVQAVAARRALEESAQEAERAISAAEAGLRDAAGAVGAAGESPDALVRELTAWQGRRAEASRADEAAVAEWQELTALLGGGSLADLTAEATRRNERALQLAASAGGGLGHDSRPDLGELRLELEREQRIADSLAGELEHMRRGLPSVAEAEEELEAARAELEGVERLAGTLDETVRLLRAAQERVHRNLAPVLATAVSRWLGVVSRGAYLEATVDPANLAVRVKEAASGQWREVRLLSEGTREQIYLLLRVAMAEHLTTGETAPLLLDEATSQSDAERKAELLGVLHALSAERQVVLFTHDDDVEGWAERTLSGPRDRLVRLVYTAARDRGRFDIGPGAGSGAVAALVTGTGE